MEHSPVMAPRRVAAALTTDDTLEDSIREVLASGADDQQQDDGQGDGADDQQQDDGQGDGADDQQQDDGQGDGADDQQQDDGQGEPQRRAAARRQREPDDNRLSPEVEQRIATAERIASDAVARADAMMQQYGQPRETPEQEAARLATMTPEQIIDYKLGKALGQHNQTIRQVTFQAQNSADKASFDASMVANPQLKRLAADVERKHADLVRESVRTGAGIPTRQTVLTYMLGEKALELAQRAAPQQRARQQRVARQQVRPETSRSDVAPSRRQSQTAEQRLENVQL